MSASILPIIVAACWMAGAGAALYLVPSLRRAAKAVARPPFIAVVVVLGVSALGLNAAVGTLQLHFKKRPVPLAVKSLNDPDHGIPARVGSWVQVSKDEAIDPEMQQVLGTGEYVFRDYVDARAWPGEDLEQLRDRPAGEREHDLGRLQVAKPESVIRVAVTYYTGMADTVSHIPERCYVADGFEPSRYETKTVSCGTYPDGRPREVSFRFITFEDQTGRGRVARNVAYLFHVDGAYESDSIAVRSRLQSLVERYGYYAKVELMTTTPGNGGHAAPDASSSPSVPAMTDLLTALLPEVERCLPDWKALHAPGRAADN